MNLFRDLNTSLIAVVPLSFLVAQAGTVTKAEYEVDISRCDAMSGDAKTSCATTAKAKFGKN